MTGFTVIDLTAKKAPDKVPDVSERGETRHRRKFAIVVPVLTGIVLVFGLILTLVYIACHVNNKAPEEGKVTFHTPDGESVTEKFVIKKDVILVTAPGRFDMVNDYTRDISVFKIDWEDGVRCYVSTLNTTLVGTPQSIRKLISHKDEFVDSASPVAEYRGTGLRVPLNVLGDDAKTLCADAPVEWVAAVDENSGDVSESTGLRVRRCGGSSKRGRSSLEVDVDLKVRIRFRKSNVNTRAC